MRLDQFLVQEGLAKSRSQARELIEAGLVSVNGSQATKVSQKCEPATQVEVKETDITKYVSRAGMKLQNALEHLDLSVEKYICLDVGISTGGFTDCLLKRGADKVVGIDVGHSQLSEKLSTNDNVVSFDGVNAKDLLEREDILKEISKLNLIVMDVSFISITKIIPSLKEICKMRPAKLLSLVKPQFELEKKNLNKQGIVKDSNDYEVVENKIHHCLSENGFKVLNYFSSNLKGGDGNEEFFVYAEISS